MSSPCASRARLAATRRGARARRQQLRVAAILALWLVATGAHWDLVQVFAWGRMFSSHAETMPLVQAAAQTFSGETCNLCKAVDQAKRQENQTPVPAAAGKSKVVLACPAAPQFIFTRPVGPRWFAAARVTPRQRREPPPSPPPKGRASSC